MNLAAFNRHCAKLPHAHSVVQWGDAHVWKIGPKVFAFAHEEAGGTIQVTFKVSWTSFEILKEQPGCRPAPYLASRGMSWIQRTEAKAMTDADLRTRIDESYAMVAAGLPKRVQAELGLIADTKKAPRTGKRSRR